MYAERLPSVSRESQPTVSWDGHLNRPDGTRNGADGVG